ncbi:DUF3592 domain-containing protein [Pseudoalteromonas neustonica]|uniref:DUF3592 domain-containing protein n=1 Tax=Pseudoalteromonas neustonica TaxID=1840331 RepID=A0ABU9U064_9GAMM
MKRSGALFGGVFFLAGFAVFYFTVLSPVIDAAKMQFWHVAQAQLISADVSSFESRDNEGHYTTLYKLDMQYKYQVDGQEYIGYRPQVNNQSNSDSSRAYSLLGQARTEQNSPGGLMIWYNPNDVSESVYDRSLSVKFLLLMSLFSGIFMAVGIGVFIYTGSQSAQPLTNVDEKKPWTTRTQWASPVIYSGAKKSIKYAWYFALLGCLFSGAFSVGLYGGNTFTTVLAALFLVLPLWLIIRARKIQKQWLHFKEVPLTINPYPGVIGGKVKGSLTIPGQTSTATTFTATLKCTEHLTKRSGTERKSSRCIVFSVEKDLTPRTSAKGAGLDFSFDVPPGQPQSSMPSKRYHEWALVIQGEIDGHSFDREYIIPVFVTAQSVSVEQELKNQPLTPTEQSAMHARLTIDEDTTIQALTLQTPGAKECLFIIALGAIFFIVGVLIATLNGSFFGIVFSAMSCLFLALGIWGYGRNCKIKVSRNSLQLDVYFFSKHVQALSFTASEIKDIDAFVSSKVQTSGKQSSEKFSLHLITHSNKTINLGGDFKTIKNALHLKQKIERILGCRFAKSSD